MLILFSFIYYNSIALHKYKVIYFNVWIRFLTKDTAIRERVKSTADAVGDEHTPFIELTICPSYGSAYKEDILKFYGMDKENYRRKGVYFPSNHTYGDDLRHIFQSITHDIHEILFRISIFTNNRKTSYFEINFEGNNFTDHLHITTKYYPYFGRCYSIHPKDHVLKLGVNAIEIVARLKIYAYFGHPGQFTYFNTKTKVGLFIFYHYTP